MKLTSLIAFFSFAAVAAQATGFVNISIRQRWPWSQKLDVSYSLEASEPQHVALELYANGQKLEILPAALSGDIWSVAPGGVHTITVDPAKTGYANRTFTNVRAVLTATAEPLYLIVDLSKTPGAAGQITSVTEEDLTNNVWGSWQRNPVSTNGVAIPSVIWTEVTNLTAHPEYATTNLVLRLVRNGSFYMGNSSTLTETQKVTITKDYYIGVFETTQKQWELVTGAKFGCYYTNLLYWTTRPVDRMSYNLIRGATLGAQWPASNGVDSASFVYQLRNKTGIQTFDLPTEAQWEYACRASTQTAFNNGTVWGTGVGRFSNTGGLVDGKTVPGQEVTTEYGTATVGSYPPNAWGLYDMHGNVAEWALDWYADLAAGPLTDPIGPASAEKRVLRNNGWWGGDYRSYVRSAAPSANGGSSSGFRLIYNP